VGTYSGNTLTITSPDCQYNGQELPSQHCIPPPGGWVIKDSNYVLTNLIGSTAATSGNCGASWLNQLNTGGGLTTTSVCGKALDRQCDAQHDPGCSGE
jgi:hypothetical protein